MAKPPYGIISNRLKAGRIVPFLGAGASFVGRTPDASWDPSTPRFLPSGSELACFLADEAGFPAPHPRDRDDLAKVSSYYVDIVGRPPLRERLRDVLNHDYQSGPMHELLADIPAPLVIVVTNYDTLVEQAFRAKGKPYDLVIYPADGKKDIANAILWWPHGTSEPLVEVAQQTGYQPGQDPPDYPQLIPNTTKILL